MIDRNGNYAAVLTPPGAGAIAILRVVGPEAERIAGGVFRGGTATSPKLSPDVSFEAGVLTYGRLVVDDETIDDGLVCQIRTGDDDIQVVDICTHGGIRVVERVLQSLERSGAEIAQADSLPVPPWRVTNQIDAEIIDALASVRTKRAAIFLAHQRCALADAVRQVGNLCSTDPVQATSRLRDLLANVEAAQRLVSGATVAIVGRPNAGKSTLFNTLVGRAATITSPHPGTTRDWVEAWVELEGIAVRLLDTAGDHDAGDELEALAIDAGRNAARPADLCIRLVDLTGIPDQMIGGWRDRHAAVRTILIGNKSDLAGKAISVSGGEIAVAVSATTGFGVERLVRRILEELGFLGLDEEHATLFSQRQAEIADRAVSDLESDPVKARKTVIGELLGFEP